MLIGDVGFLECFCAKKHFVLRSYSAALLLLINASGNKENSATDARSSTKEIGKVFIEKLYNVDDQNIFQ